MRYIIGIVVGILIVFNWNSVKSMFDNSVAKQGQELTHSSSIASGKAPTDESSKAAQVSPEPTQNLDLTGTVEERLKAIASGK